MINGVLVTRPAKKFQAITSKTATKEPVVIDFQENTTKKSKAGSVGGNNKLKEILDFVQTVGINIKVQKTKEETTTYQWFTIILSSNILIQPLPLHQSANLSMSYQNIEGGSIACTSKPCLVTAFPFHFIDCYLYTVNTKVLIATRTPVD